MSAGTEFRPWPPQCEAGPGYYSVHDPNSEQTSLYPSPLLEDEEKISERPSASKHFSFHPGGAVKLYRDARYMAEQVSADLLNDGDTAYFERQLWLLCSITFVPGDSVRSGHDRLTKKCEFAASGRRHKPTKQELRADALRLLAAHFIGLALTGKRS